MTIHAFDPRATIRNPASPSIRVHTRADVAHESAAAFYLETIFLGSVLAAVAGVVPLVMLLHG